MGAKKLKIITPSKVSPKNQSPKHLKLVKAENNAQQKVAITHYRELIHQMLQEPEMIKKAAMLLSEMVNSK